MADIGIDSSIDTSTARGMRSVVFTTADIGYWFYIDSTAGFVFSKTTDGGATWGTAIPISGAVTTVAFDVWFDQWTPGDSGTTIGTWYFNTATDRVYFNKLDTSSDTLSTVYGVYTGVSAVAGRGAFVSGTKTRSGYYYCAYDIDAGAEMGLCQSPTGATWTSVSTTFVEATLDECLLFPASNTGDDNDCWALYYHDSTFLLTLKMWDSSAGSAIESVGLESIAGNGTDLVGQRGFSGTIRHSDGHLIAINNFQYDSASGYASVLDIAGTSTVTQKTNITTNIDDHYYHTVFIDQTTDDIYVAYNGKRDGSEVLGTSTKVYYVKSTDGGTTWSAGDTAYSESSWAAVQVWAPLMGPRFYVGWRDGQAAQLIGNFVNSLVLGSNSVVTLVGSVGTGHNESATGATSIAATRTGIIAGNTIVVAVRQYTSDIINVSDGTITNSTPDAWGYYTFYHSLFSFPNHAGGDFTFTANFVGSCLYRAIVILELTPSVFEGSAGAGGTSATPSSGNISPAPTVDGEYIVGLASSPSGVAITPAGSFSDLYLSHDSYYSDVEGLAQATAAAIAATWTQASAQWGAIAASYRSAERLAALTGPAAAGITESDIVAGGKTIILTLTGESWIPA